MINNAERYILFSAIFVIASNVDEASDPVRAQLELEGRSRGALIAPSTASSDFASAPLLKDYVRLRRSSEPRPK